MLKSGAGDEDDRMDELSDDEDAIWETSDRWLLEPQTPAQAPDEDTRSEEHTSELQSQ